jgi:hypothetical protein
VRRTFLSAAVLLAAFHGVAWATGKFESVSVHLERTVEDEDSEVVFEAIGAGDGLTALKVVAPDGRTVIDYKATDSKLGMRHLTLESPEPKNDDSLKADFPAGIYQFTGITTKGTTLVGEAALSHKIPDVAHVVRPGPAEKNVPVTGMHVTWNNVKDAVAFVLVIEQEKTGREIKANLPGTAAGFSVSDGFLVPGLEYKLAIGTVAKDGNRSFTETTFVTAAKN